MITAEMKEIIEKNRVWYCVDCGKCGAVCPISRWETQSFTSPRLLIEKSLHGKTEELWDDPLFWSCLICQRCTELCPSTVHFSEFIRDSRTLARSNNRSGSCTHSDMIQTWGRLMTNPDLKQNRLGWVTGNLKTSNTSDTVYFVGCLPYFDPVFKKLGVKSLSIAQASVKIMNSLGIEPQVMADERCCGHDQLWDGDMDTFQALAKINIKNLSKSGAKRIVSACPECVRTIKYDYPEFMGDHGMEVLHITELLDQLEFPTPKKDLESKNKKITYHDPCNLGRHLGVYEAPRQIMRDQGYELVEMGRTRNQSLCCGTSCWSSCGQTSKNIQVDRLQEAKGTNADLLVTACIKCQIHFKCAQNDPIIGEQIDIKIRDITTLIAEDILET
jgi:heterodisulfide reductase subunit D